MHFWVSAEAWSARYICLWKGAEKTAELWNRVVFIRAFRRSEPPEQLFTSLPIASKQVVPIYYSRNSRVKISSDGGAGRAQGTEASVPFSAFPETSGDKAGMGSSVPSLPYQTLPGLWKMEKFQGTQKYWVSLTAGREVTPEFAWGICACSAHWNTWGGETQSNN